MTEKNKLAAAMPENDSEGAPSPSPSPSQPRLAYSTKMGKMVFGRVEDALDSKLVSQYKGKVQLVFTSPPYPLHRKKRYGNQIGDAYLEWLADLAPRFKALLKPSGSIVIELGNAWEPGKPVMSVLPIEALLAFLKRGELHLCEQFVCENPARLPGPAQWVNVERIRVKDAFTHVWWMGVSERPRANNKRVLVEYSEAMRRLLKKRTYNAGGRPSEHKVSSEGFFKSNGGAIPSNVLRFANTQSSDAYLRYCRENGLTAHPARMPAQLADFFIRFLTNKGDLVLDPFGGSNTTGAVAESLGRKWVSIEAQADYIRGSVGRFGPDYPVIRAESGIAPVSVEPASPPAQS